LNKQTKDVAAEPKVTGEELIEIQDPAGGDGSVFKIPLQRITNTPNYIFLGANERLHQVIQPKTWTVVQWPHEFANVTGWVLNSLANGYPTNRYTDGALEIPNNVADLGVWEHSGSVAWRSIDIHSDPLTIHRRKLKFLYSSNEGGIREFGGQDDIWHPDASKGETGLLCLSNQQVYGVSAFDPAETAHRVWMECWHNNPTPVKVVRAGIIAPLYMVAKAGEY